MAMKRWFCFTILFLFLGFNFSSFQSYDTNAKIKSIFVYNFTRYIEWPAEYKQGNFIIGILGESPLYKELNGIASAKKAANQAIDVVQFSSADAIKKCHILFIPQTESSALNSCISKTNSQSTLIITENNGLAQQGSCINFVIQNNKQKFELNLKNTENKNLKVSSSLKDLSIVVD